MRGHRNHDHAWSSPLVVVAAVVVGVTSIPDIKRYLKMRQM